jgi:type IV secretory pathway VirB4 component
MASQATQEFVPIKEVRDGIIILKDGSMRAIVMTSSVNFALKSEDEQKSIIYQFQNFLNSLDFSVQISLQSRRLDIRPYVALLENRQKEQTNDLMKIQIKEYIQFIKTFTESTKIMTKSFFIVIPYTPPVLDITKGVGKKKSTQNNIEDFEENRIQLEQRVSVVQEGIVRSGVRAVKLGTEEVVEVFYKLFNPGDVEKPIPLQ